MEDSFNGYSLSGEEGREGRIRGKRGREEGKYKKEEGGEREREGLPKRHKLHEQVILA